MKVLIGDTGFVGGTLLRQTNFDRTYNSKNIQELRGQDVKTLVCAGISAAKWLANRDPEGDWMRIASLIEVLRDVKCGHFVLISTVDIYPNPIGCDEGVDLATTDGSAYGRNRLLFERFVADSFPSNLIIRLPALFGMGLKKNVLYDLLHNNCLDMINQDSVFQWYDMQELWSDIQRASDARLKLVNLVNEPIATAEIISRWFQDKSVGSNASAQATYDVKTRYAHTFGSSGEYFRSAEQVLSSMGNYINGVRADETRSL